MQLSPRSRILAVVAALAVLLAACGGGDGDSAETAGVASVDDLNEATTDAVDAAEDETEAEVSEDDAEEIVLAMSQCMRDNGWDDFPDPVPDGNGGFGLRAAILSSGIDFQNPDFREQLEVCQAESGADQLGTSARNNNREALEEGLLVYTDCLRAEGLDVGDLTFDGGQGAQGGQAQGQGQADGADGEGRGQPQGQGGAGGDRAERIANRLGLDLEDPDVVAALEACEPTLDEALAGFGQGGGQQPAAATTDS